MKTGTTFNITLIADERMLGNCANCETLIAVKRNSLRTAIYDEGIETYSFGEEKVLDNFADQKEKQIRQNITMFLSKHLLLTYGFLVRRKIFKIFLYPSKTYYYICNIKLEQNEKIYNRIKRDNH